MKQLARLTPLLAFLAAVAITTVAVRWRAVRQPWQPLKGGGEVRLFAVLHGNEPLDDWFNVSWRDRLREAWAERSLGPLTSEEDDDTRPTDGTPAIALGLEARNLPNSGIQLDRSEMVLPDGQVFRIRASASALHGKGADARWHYIIEFPLIPARARTLRWNVVINGAMHRFDAPNTAFRTDLPVWKAEPLPQTRHHEDVALTLKAMPIEPSSRKEAPTDWVAKPMWKITRGGQSADELYRIIGSFEDSAGNITNEIGLFSEPVWKVRATVSRLEQFPFSEDEVCWAGTIDPAAPTARSSQGYALAVRSEKGAARRLKLVGVFGPGKYEIKDAAVISTAEVSGKADRAGEWDPTRKVHTVRLDRPALIIIEDYEDETDEMFDVLVFRDVDGSFNPPDVRWRGSLTIYELPSKPLRVGLARSAPFTLEFLITAPERLALKQDTAHR